jgi:hypothetical protein
MVANQLVGKTAANLSDSTDSTEAIIFADRVATRQPFSTWDSQTLAWLATHSLERLKNKLTLLSQSQKTELNKLMVIVSLAFDSNYEKYDLRVSYSGIKELLITICPDYDDNDVKAFIGLYANPKNQHSQVCSELIQFSETKYNDLFNSIEQTLQTRPVWFRYADRMFVVLADRDLSNITFAPSETDVLSMAGVDFSGVDFSNSSMYSLELSNANLSGATFTNCTLSDVNLSGADLSGVRLIGTRLYTTTVSKDTRWDNIEFIGDNPNIQRNIVTLKLSIVRDEPKFDEALTVIASIADSNIKLFLVAQLCCYLQISLPKTNKSLALRLLEKLKTHYPEGSDIKDFINHCFIVNTIQSATANALGLAKKINQNDIIPAYKTVLIKLIYFYVVHYIYRNDEDLESLVRHVEDQLSKQNLVTNYCYRMIEAAGYFEVPPANPTLAVKFVFNIIVQELHTLKSLTIRQELMSKVFRYLDNLKDSNLTRTQGIYLRVLDVIKQLPNNQIYQKIIDKHPKPLPPKRAGEESSQTPVSKRHKE